MIRGNKSLTKMRVNNTMHFKKKIVNLSEILKMNRIIRTINKKRLIIGFAFKLK
jgi:hypothetical protein